MQLQAVQTIFVLYFLYAHTVTGQRTCFAGSFREGKKCTPCPPGTFSDKLNSLSCEPCDTGSFRATEGASSSQQCIPCFAGTFSNITGATKCQKCPRGTDSSPGAERFGPTDCLFCPAGSELRSDCDKCKKGFFAAKAGTEFCTRCPDGSVATRKGATQCEKCPPGTFRRYTAIPGVGFVSSFTTKKCINCQAGTFSDESGAISCQLCPLGTFSKKGASKCTPCPPNTFNLVIPATRCRDCPSRSSTRGPGAAACKKKGEGCPINTFEDKDGQCQACMPGEKLDRRKKQCIPCGMNEVSNGGADTVCRVCPKDHVPLGDLSMFEKSECQCAPRFYLDRKGCVLCPPGTFWNNKNSFFLATDDLARERFGPGIEGGCLPCPTGTFADKPGMLSCKPCPVNTFQDQEGGTICMKCPPGSRSPNFFDFAIDTVTNRERCVVDETGCDAGAIRNRDGVCQAVTCPSKNTFLSGKNCIQCDFRFRAAGNRGCKECRNNERSPGGATEKCIKCPKGQEGDAFSDTCECPFGKSFDQTGKCVTRCPTGFGTQTENDFRFGRFSDFCARCPRRTVSNLETDFECIQCKSNTIAVDGKRCVPCPKGQVVGKDIYGILLDTCRPRNP